MKVNKWLLLKVLPLPGMLPLQPLHKMNTTLNLIAVFLTYSLCAARLLVNPLTLDRLGVRFGKKHGIGLPSVARARVLMVSDRDSVVGILGPIYERLHVSYIYR